MRPLPHAPFIARTTRATEVPQTRSLELMELEAIVLAGGRGSRLGDVDKAALEVSGESMLDRTLRALAGLRVIVVGPGPVPEGVLSVCEEPRFAGPAAAIGAGLREVSSPYVLVVACDQPFLADALPALLAGVGDREGAIAVDADGRRQNLMVAVRTSALAVSLARFESLEGRSVRELLAVLDLREVQVPRGSTLDLDTWHDVEQARIAVNTDHQEVAHD